MKTESLRPLAEWQAHEISSYLREIGEDQLADEIEDSADEVPLSFGLLDFAPKPWQHTAHRFGYIAPVEGREHELPLVSASTIEPDERLIGAAVKLTLDRLHVADYPGKGPHQIALDFEGQSQATDELEQVQFAYATVVRDGGGGSIGGWPVFIGMRVGAEGLAFRCRTINVRNKSDDPVMAVLASESLKQGLGLAASAQPALIPLVALVEGLTAGLLEARRNVVVQDFALGLDFSRMATRACLREGSYVAAQVADSTQQPWRWDDWLWSRESARLVNRLEPTLPSPYNYLVFSISRMMS